MRRDILGVRTQHTLESLLRPIELAVREVSFAQDPIGIEVIGVVF
jgi:hypothetical protein